MTELLGFAIVGHVSSQTCCVAMLTPNIPLGLNMSELFGNKQVHRFNTMRYISACHGIPISGCQEIETPHVEDAVPLDLRLLGVGKVRKLEMVRAE